MSRIFISVLLALTFYSCTKDDEMTVERSRIFRDEYSPTRTLAEAYAIANSAANVSDGTTRTSAGKRISFGDTHFVISEATRTAGTADTLYYIINYENEEGFVLVPRNRSLPDVVVLTEQGSYDGEETENEMFNMLMDGANNYASRRIPIDTSIAIIRPTPIYVDSTYTDTLAHIRPMLSARWGQYAPYNMCCPIVGGKTSVAGCVAIAIGQIMSAYKYPTNIKLSYDGRDINEQQLNWSTINSIADHSMWVDECSDHRPLARMIREIGKQAKTTYYGDKSSAYDKDVPSVLTHFGYKSSKLKNFDLSQAISSLKDKMPVYFAATHQDTTRHAMVLDGYCYISERVKIWEGPRMWETGKEWPGVLVSDYTTTSEYIHCNLGYHGKSNGWYSSRVLVCTSSCKQLDEGCIPANNYNFNQDIKMVTNIRPQ